MISYESGKVKISGTKVELLAEMTTLMNAMIREDIAEADDLTECVRLASLSKDDLDKEVSNVLSDDTKKELDKLLDDVFNLLK